eukprot:s1152_g16.t1
MLSRTVGQKQLENPSVLCDWTGGDLLWALVLAKGILSIDDDQWSTDDLALPQELPELQRAILNAVLQLGAPSAAFWDEESDGAVPLEQRNAELVRHRDGLAEAALACQIQPTLVRRWWQVVAGGGRWIRWIRWAAVTQEDSNLLLHLVSFLTCLHHPAPHLQVKHVEAYGHAHADTSASLTQSLQDFDLQLWCLLANAPALLPVPLHFLRAAADLAFFSPPPRQVLSGFISATLATVAAVPPGQHRMLAALSVIAANAQVTPSETPSTVKPWQDIGIFGVDRPNLGHNLLAYPMLGMDLIFHAPDQFRCALDGQLMMDPVRTPQGLVFERSRLAHLAGAEGKCPCTVLVWTSSIQAQKNMAGGRKAPMNRSQRSAAAKAAAAPAATVPREEALERLQEAFNAEQGLKLFEAQAGTAAEYDKAEAEKYKAVIEAKIVTLENEAALLTGKDNKKERAAKGKEVAELKAGQQYVDACKIVKGLEPKFGYFMTKEAVLPDAPVSKTEEEETKVVSNKKETKKETKKESAGLSPAETKELESLKQQIIERKAILKEQGLSGGQQNKDEEIVKMVARMNELKEKQDPGSTKKEKDGKKDGQPSSLLQAGSQVEKRVWLQQQGHQGGSRFEGHGEPPCGFPKAELRADALCGLARRDGSGLEDCARAMGADALMRHPAADVRCCAAKCLAEVLRIFVPSPPLEKERMQPILELFLEQLALLKDPSGPSYTDAFGLLERLTEIRGFMLVFDCPEPENIIVSLVSTCVSAVRPGKSGAETYNQLENLMAPLLTNILGEADEIPKKALAELLEELIIDQKRAAQNATGLVRRVLAGLASKSAAAPINDYVNKALFTDDEQRAEQKGAKQVQALGYNMAQDRLEGLLYATYELYSIHPSLVARVLPNLQADLQNANPDRRRATTAVIGQILAHCHQQAIDSMALATSNAALVDRFRERLGDADDGVRMTALEGTGAIMQSAIQGEVADLRPIMVAAESLRERLADRCLDPNDAIRLRAVEIITEGAGLTFTLPILPDACRRILDKKPRVREACAEASAHLYATHALWRWTEGRFQEAQKLNWIPQLLCEAYAAFCSSRLGYVAQLEEHIEQHVLGCGAGLSDGQRALAMLGFYTSAAQGQNVVCESAAHGLSVVFSKKRDCHKLLQQFIQLRIAKGAPLAAEDAGSMALVPHNEEQPQQVEILERLGRLSPTMDDKYSRPDAVAAHLRAFDAVRDKALWKQLEKLLDPLVQENTSQLGESLQELDRLLRVHRLSELAPLVRRALLSTWLLPDQVAQLLDLWKGGTIEVLDEAPCSELVAAARTTISSLSKTFPGAFMPFAGELAKQLPDSSAEDAKVILQTLAAIAKRVLQKPVDENSLQLSTEGLSQMLLDALAVAGDSRSSRASMSRKVAKILLLLPSAERSTVCMDLLRWAEENVSGDAPADEASVNAAAMALQLAAALLEWSKRHLEDFPQLEPEDWLKEAKKVLATPNSQRDDRRSDVQCAAADLLAVTGSTDDVTDVLLAPSTVSESLALTNSAGEDGAWAWFDPLPVHACCASLRALRLGCVQLSTKLLANLAGRFAASMASDRPTIDAENLLESLLTMKRSSIASQLKPAERLRVCTALPTVFALAPLKKHRDTAQRMLQGSLKAAWQGSQLELLDFAVACFVHFLSRLDIFKKEVSARISAFPESSKVAAFFCEALLRCDAPHSAELLGVALRVCDRDPSSDAVHRAGSVLRYVAEKRCPELGLQGAALLHGAARGSMPAQLFAIRQPTGAAPALPDATMQELQLAMI